MSENGDRDAPAPGKDGKPRDAPATSKDKEPGKEGFKIAADDEADTRPVDLRVARMFLPYMRPYVGLAAFSLSLVLTRTSIGLLGPLFQGLAVGSAAAHEGQRVLLFAGGLVLVCVLLFFFGWAQSYQLTKLGQSVLFDIRRDLFRHVESRAPAFFQTWPVGRLISRVANDVEQIAELFSTGMAMIVGDVITIVGVLGVLLAWDTKLALAGLAALPLIVAIALAFRKPVRKAHRENRRRMAKLAAFLNERITGIRVVRAFAAEREDLGRFGAVNDEVFAGYRRSIHLDGLFNPGIFAASSLGTAGLLWIGGIDVSDGRVEPGKLFAFLMYVQWLYQPIRDLTEKYTLIQRAMASSERIVELLSIEDTVPDPRPADALALPARRTASRGMRIELDRVTFSYVSGAPPALEDVSLTVEPGETLAIVGATGAGKSTIANLVARFWDPEKGTVRLEGIDLRRLGKKTIRENVALVLQDVFLFAGTIEENIALRPVLTREDRARVEAAARAVAAHEVIERLGGYGATVEERGATLSQGERQLISFARARAPDPSVLVLDEATASLDPETEARLQAGVRALTAGRTAIVIAHRLATVREATRIAVLHKGKLRELGHHDELVRAGGIYAKLVELQMGALVPA
ncbi:ABC transporter ATP-binding protein [bacterium]|nr:ABC transporter ATP-binding protein [bacterium]